MHIRGLKACLSRATIAARPWSWPVGAGWATVNTSTQTRPPPSCATSFSCRVRERSFGLEGLSCARA